MRWRHFGALCALVGGFVALPVNPVSGHVGPATPTATVINTTAFGGGSGSGSTVGPDGALYVTNGKDGTLVRVDTSTGAATVVGTGLPKAQFEIGGAIDVVFHHGRAFVLVTLAGADVGNPTATMGIYRQLNDGTFELFADIGSWAQAHPPVDPDVFLSQGVQYALDVWRDGFLVTDGHHGRVLEVDGKGTVSEYHAFATTDQVVTGIETTKGKSLVAMPGPIPHLPSTSKIVEIQKGQTRVVGEWANSYSGNSGLIVDVEYGRADQLYGLLQGWWNLPPTPDNEGFPAAPNTGEIVVVDNNGKFRSVISGLNQPTSFEIIGRTAYVVTLTGTVVRVDGM